MEKEKILIIKTGYSEFLGQDNNSKKVSLGDILRITPLLNIYKNKKVTWVTDPIAFPLLEGNKYLERLLPYDLTTVLQLNSERFDTLINLEKIPGICALSDRINAWKRYGFRFDSETGEAKAYDRAFEVLSVSADPIAKKKNKWTIQKLLFDMVGTTWQGEEYLLGYKPKTTSTFDIGLNTTVGDKLPIKEWPKQNWDKLENILIRNGFNVTRQDKNKEVLTNLYFYMDWLNSCDTIITSDTLGMHLGIALKKKVLGLFGPTSPNEVYFYERGEAILPELTINCIPCFGAEECIQEKICMNSILPERVYEKFKNIIDCNNL